MKIRGNTVGTPLSIEKIKEEISTALIVELETWNDPWTASHSAIEITRHLDKGPVIFMSEWDFIKLNNIRNEFNGDSFAIFKTAADENGVWKEYTIDDNKNVTVKEMSLSSAVETLVVTIDESTNKASHTAEQITEHIQNGGNVVLHWNESYYLPAIATNTLVSFAHAVSIMDETTIFGVSVFANGDVVKIDVPLATANQIGSIETALDSIIAIQNQLIGGDA